VAPAVGRQERVNPADSAVQEEARRREQAIRDSIARVQRARGDSILAERRREAAGAPAPKQSPIFGNPPFYGYTWVFGGDVLLGALSGVAALRLRRRNQDTPPHWQFLALLGGAAWGAAVFLPFFLMNALLVFFNPMPTGLMFGFTAAVIVVAGLSVGIGRKRG